jgi:uncharacterized protein (DUF58 family)
LSKLLETAHDRLLQGLQRWSGRANNVATQPLLEPDRLLDIARHARALTHPLFEFHHPSASPLIGENLSRFRGQGLEFEDNRPYQPGDDTRLINWRLYARSGNLYTRVYTEDRRPQLYVVVDRRAGMRFGTRRQLKATLAASIAACHLYQATHGAIAAGGLVLDDTLHWFNPVTGSSALEPLIRQLAAPCPPREFDDHQPLLDAALRMLAQRSRSGGFVLLVSDFSDLDTHSTTALLHRLAQQHNLHAVEITDPAERSLPTSGDYLIDDGDADQPLRISGRDHAQHRAYTAALESRRAAVADAFARCAIPFTRCSTDSSYQDCLVPGDAGRQRR